MAACRACAEVVNVESGKCRDAFAGTAFELPVLTHPRRDFDVSPTAVISRFVSTRTKTGDGTRNADRRDRSEIRKVESADLRLGAVAPQSGVFARRQSRSQSSPAITEILYRRCHLALIDRASGRVSVERMGSFNQCADALANQQTANPSTTAEDNARLSLWRMPVGKKTPQMIVAGGTVQEFDLKGETLAYVRNTMSTPPRKSIAPVPMGRPGIRLNRSTNA